MAVVKPAGLTTANAPAGKPSLFNWLQSRGGPHAFVGIVSRLDAPVSGLVVVAKTSRAAAGLAAQFRERTTEKRYTAVVTGRFPAPLGATLEWHDWLARGSAGEPSRIVPELQANQHNSRGRAGVSKTGPAAAPQEAFTRARVLRRGGETCLVELEPVTGRRHQLRAQLAARGCPIVGDRLYGSRLPFPLRGGIALHATRLTLTHPETGLPLLFEAPLPPEWNPRFCSLLVGGPSH